jgi:hypothetical protein
MIYRFIGWFNGWFGSVEDDDHVEWGQFVIIDGD